MSWINEGCEDDSREENGSWEVKDYDAFEACGHYSNNK